MVLHGMISIKSMKTSKSKLIKVKYSFNLDNK